MFKVIVVDDEPIIRNGIVKIIDWEKYDCYVAAEAEDGEGALELIRDLEPDIIITDIRMGDMDGMAMIKEARELVKNAKFVILSGYRDFEYAKTALSLGVYDFILKPTRRDEIKMLISKLTSEMKRERDKEEELLKLKRHLNQNIATLSEKMFYNAIFGINQRNNGQIESQIEMYGIDLSKYILVMVDTDKTSLMDKIGYYEKQLSQLGCADKFKEFFVRYSVYPVSIHLERQLFVVCINNEDFIYNNFCHECERYQQSVFNCYSLTVSISISSVGSGISSIQKLFSECQDAITQKMYVGDNIVLACNDIDNFLNEEEHDDLLFDYRKQLLKNVRLGNNDLSGEILESISGFLSAADVKTQNAARRFYYMTFASLKDLRDAIIKKEHPDYEETVESFSNLFSMFEKCERVEDLHELLKNACFELGNRINHIKKENIGLKVKKIIKFAEDNYMEQFTLYDIAEKLCVSTFYISRIFKNETGKNLFAYLHEIRMEKAKELLGDVRYKVYEIAELVGIPDAHYFSKTFKKYTGNTPMEYRDMSIGVNDNDIQ